MILNTIGLCCRYLTYVNKSFLDKGNIIVGLIIYVVFQIHSMVYHRQCEKGKEVKEDNRDIGILYLRILGIALKQCSER